MVHHFLISGDGRVGEVEGGDVSGLWIEDEVYTEAEEDGAEDCAYPWKDGMS